MKKRVIMDIIDNSLIEIVDVKDSIKELLEQVENIENDIDLNYNDLYDEIRILKKTNKKLIKKLAKYES